MKSAPPDQRTQLLRVAGLGIEFAGGLLGFTLVGWAVDRWLGSAPVGVLSGAVLGCVGGLYLLIRKAVALHASFRAAPPSRRDDGGA